MTHSTSKIQCNLLAPVSVSMVVITLGAAFGVLSGRGALIGMVSTCIITLISAVFSGSRYGISSPTGPMTAAIGAILVTDKLWLQTHHVDLDVGGLVNLTMITAGIVLILLTILKVHQLVRFVPNLVISGFVNGIALLIIIAQFRNMQDRSDWMLMFATFAVALGISKYTHKLPHMVWRLMGSSFAVIVLMSIIVWIFHFPVNYLDLSNEEFAISFSLPPLQALHWETVKIIFPLAFELALISLLDTLLTAIIIDTKSKTTTKMKRELTGQSISLAILSFFGGIPGAKSTVPSIMMWQEGGHHRFSKLVLALCCIAFTFLFSEAIQFVPLAVFGGIILKIALDVADIKSLQYLLKYSSKYTLVKVFILIGTALSTVFVSLNLAVILFTCFFLCWNTVVKKQFRIADLRYEKESEGLGDEI